MVLSMVLAAAPVVVLAPAAHAEEGARKKSGGGSFIPIRTLTANTFHADGRRGVFTVESGVDAPDPALHDRAAALIPVLRDAYAATIRTFAAGLRPNEAPNLDLLEARMQADTNRVLGRPGARLLLGSVMSN
jgi:hypothetical protein